MWRAWPSQSHHSGIERAATSSGAGSRPRSQSHHSGIESEDGDEGGGDALQVPIAPQWD